MKSVQEVMETKTFVEYKNDKYSISGYIHLVPIRESSIYNEVESKFTDVSILDAEGLNSMYLPELDQRMFRNMLNEFVGRASMDKIDEWADAVRYERRYDLYQGYQNAIADYLYATGGQK
jgi:hypothetical protein